MFSVSRAAAAFIAALLLLALASASANGDVPLSEQLKGSKPNIVFILLDDSGFGDLGKHSARFCSHPVFCRLELADHKRNASHGQACSRRFALHRSSRRFLIRCGPLLAYQTVSFVNRGFCLHAFSRCCTHWASRTANGQAAMSLSFCQSLILFCLQASSIISRRLQMVHFGSFLDLLSMTLLSIR